MFPALGKTGGWIPGTGFQRRGEFTVPYGKAHSIRSQAQSISPVLAMSRWIASAALLSSLLYGGIAHTYSPGDNVDGGTSLYVPWRCWLDTLGADFSSPALHVSCATSCLRGICFIPVECVANGAMNVVVR